MSYPQKTAEQIFSTLELEGRRVEVTEYAKKRVYSDLAGCIEWLWSRLQRQLPYKIPATQDAYHPFILHFSVTLPYHRIYIWVEDVWQWRVYYMCQNKIKHPHSKCGIEWVQYFSENASLDISTWTKNHQLIISSISIWIFIPSQIWPIL